MALFRARDKDGNYYDLPFVKGEPGYTPVKGVDYFTDEEKAEFTEPITAHTSSTDNPHNVTKEQLGLSNVNNTSDMDKPVSVAQAEAIAVHADNKENPHNVTKEQIGAASAGFGYGETMVWLGFNPATWESTGKFQADLEATFNAMPQGSCKQVQFYDTNLHTQKFSGTLWKYTSSYGFLTADNYSGAKAIKTYYDGVWQPWEWENPPMVTGKEYRTTERYNGKTVYVKNVSFGKLPNTTEKTVEHGLGGGQIDTIVSFDVFAYDTGSTTVRKLPFFTTAGVLSAHCYVTNARVGVVTHRNASDYTAMVRMRYTRV